MRITFTFDDNALMRKRYIKVKSFPKYPIGPAPIYQPLHSFMNTHRAQGYPFSFIELLHTTGLMILTPPSSRSSWLRRTLLVTGGLYLALDVGHADLAIRRRFGDFTSGFSHQFGVGLTALAMSQAFNIRWDSLQAVPVRGEKVLDFLAAIPGGTLQVEAKGVTSRSSRSSARRSICEKN